MWIQLRVFWVQPEKGVKRSNTLQHISPLMTRRNWQPVQSQCCKVNGSRTRRQYWLPLTFTWYKLWTTGAGRDCLFMPSFHQQWRPKSLPEWMFYTFQEDKEDKRCPCRILLSSIFTQGLYSYISYPRWKVSSFQKNLFLRKSCNFDWLQSAKCLYLLRCFTFLLLEKNLNGLQLLMLMRWYMIHYYHLWILPGFYWLGAKFCHVYFLIINKSNISHWTTLHFT